LNNRRAQELTFHRHRESVVFIIGTASQKQREASSKRAILGIERIVVERQPVQALQANVQQFRAYSQGFNFDDRQPRTRSAPPLPIRASDLVDIMELKELLGHRRVTTAQIYDKRRRAAR
jgi:hypothetical protein